VKYPVDKTPLGVSSCSLPVRRCKARKNLDAKRKICRARTSDWSSTRTLDLIVVSVGRTEQPDDRYGTRDRFFAEFFVSLAANDIVVATKIPRRPLDDDDDDGTDNNPRVTDESRIKRRLVPKTRTRSDISPKKTNVNHMLYRVLVWRNASKNFEKKKKTKKYKKKRKTKNQAANMGSAPVRHPSRISGSP